LDRFRNLLRYTQLTLPLIILAVFSAPKLPRKLLWPDSGSYVYNSSLRGLVYPGFLDLVVSKKSQETIALSSDLFFHVAWIQWGIFVLVAFFLLRYLGKLNGFAPLAFALFFIGHSLFFREAYFFGNFRDYLSFILSEGLSYSWVLALGGLALYRTSQGKPSLSTTFLMTMLACLGIEIAPRLMPLVLVILGIPFLLWLLEARKKERLGHVLFPILFFGLAVFLRCTVNEKRFGVFVLNPIQPMTLTAVAFQFGNPESYKKFEDPFQREFVRRVFQSEKRLPTGSGNEFINVNFYKIGTTTYEEMTGKSPSDDLAVEYSRWVGPIARKILLNDKDAIARWLNWVMGEVGSLWRKSSYISPFHVLLGVVLLILSLKERRRSLLPLVSLVLLMGALLTLLLALLLQGFDPRYAVSGEILVVLVTAVTLVLLLEKIPSFRLVTEKSALAV
jgi:hypothetical protein